MEPAIVIQGIYKINYHLDEGGKWNVHKKFRRTSGRYMNILLSVIKQKDESQNRCFKKTKHFKLSEKRTFLIHLLSGGKKCSFFGKFDVLCFLEIPVLRFALLPYNRRYIVQFTSCIQGVYNEWPTQGGKTVHRFGLLLNVTFSV